MATVYSGPVGESRRDSVMERQAKIVGTIGPASADPKVLLSLFKAGLKKAKWKDRELSEKFRDDILLRLGEYISPGDNTTVGSAKDISEKVKEAIEKE